MDPNRTPARDASSSDAAAPFTQRAALPAPDAFSAHPEEGRSASEDPSRRTKRHGWLEGHLPERVEPLVPQDPDTALTATRRLRHDGWTPEKKSRFLERFAECGVVLEACETVAMSARSAYNLRDRDPLFAAGWDAASVLARPRLADEAWSRAMNGVVERIYRDGVIVAERHKYDNRLTMSVLARLDSRIDRAEEKGAAHLRLVERWDDYLAALAEDRVEDGRSLLAPPPAAAAEAGGDAGDRELHELHPAATRAETERAEARNVDPHTVWEEEDGWWTDYPPPPGFDGEQEGDYGKAYYRRTLSPPEQAVIDAEEAEEAEQAAADLALAEAQRDAWFGFAPELAEDEGGAEEAHEPGRAEEAEEAEEPDEAEEAEAPAAAADRPDPPEEPGAPGAAAGPVASARPTAPPAAASAAGSDPAPADSDPAAARASLPPCSTSS